MDFTITHFPAFNIAGLTIRTANAGGRAIRDIGALWQQFIAQGILQTIPNRHSDDIYCMYTEYEKDANAPYTVILGCRVNALDGLPAGITGKEIGENTYRLYTSATQDSVVTTWVHIWQSEIDRAYEADFDVYKQDGSVGTYLSVHS